LTAARPERIENGLSPRNVDLKGEIEIGLGLRAYDRGEMKHAGVVPIYQARNGVSVCDLHLN